MKQAVEDIGKDDKAPIVVTKDDRKDTLVTMKLNDFLPMFAAWLAQGKEE